MSDLGKKLIQLLSSPHYQRLATFRPPFDPLDVLGIPHRELSFSSVLRWLLSAPENKEFQQEFLKWIINKLKIDGHFRFDQKISVKREYGHGETGRIDLFAQVQSPDIVLAIEIKVKSVEGHQQIPRYQQFLQNKYASIENKGVVFITDFGRPPDEVLNIPEVPVLSMSWKWIADNLNQCEGHGEMHDFRIQFAEHIRRSVLMQRKEKQMVIDLLREGDNAKTIRRIINNLPDLGEKKYTNKYKSIVANVLDVQESDLELSKYPSKGGAGTTELKVRVTRWNDAGLPFTLMLYNYEKIAVRVLIGSERYERHEDLLTNLSENSEGFVGEFPKIRGWSSKWRSIIESDGDQWVPQETIVGYEIYEVVHDEFWDKVEEKLRRQMDKLLPLIEKYLGRVHTIGRKHGILRHVVLDAEIEGESGTWNSPKPNLNG